MAWPPITHQDVQDAVSHLRGGMYRVDDYGADSTGATDSTAAFQTALAAMPTAIVYATATVPGRAGAGSGTSASYPVGTLLLGAGTYRLGATIDVGNLGPFVSIIGPGRTACTLDYRGGGDCLRAYNAVRDGSDTFFNLNGMAGRFDGFTIAGENAAPGAVGLHIGDAEGWRLGQDLYIRNFTGTVTAPTVTLGATATTGGTFTANQYYWRISSVVGTTSIGETPLSGQVYTTVAVNGTQTLTWAAVPGASAYRIYRSDDSGNYAYVTQTTATSYTDTGSKVSTLTGWPTPPGASSIGLLFDNQYSWTENVHGDLTVFNCATCVVFNAGGGSVVQNGVTGGDNSFEYNHLRLKLYCFAGQNGIVLQNGALYQHSSLYVYANVQRATTSQSYALLTLTGVTPTGHLGAGLYSQFTMCDLFIRAESNGAGGFYPQTVKFGDVTNNAVYNSTGILSFTGPWTASNWSLASSYAVGTFQLSGVVYGDHNLAPANGLQTTMGQYYAQTSLFPDGGLPLASGDVATPLTLTGNTTIKLQQNASAAQRKILVVKQAAAGGPYTLTWPRNASPTTSSPTVLWPAGTAPAMTTTANATDVYELVTYDGATWYGFARQNLG